MKKSTITFSTAHKGHFNTLIPEVTPLARFAFNYVETQLHSLQNPSKLGSYSLVSVFATHAG